MKSIKSMFENVSNYVKDSHLLTIKISNFTYHTSTLSEISYAICIEVYIFKFFIIFNIYSNIYIYIHICMLNVQPRKTCLYVAYGHKS